MTRPDETGLILRRTDRDDREVHFGDEAPFEFWIKNSGSSSVDIQEASVSCQPDIGVASSHPALRTTERGLRIRIAGGGQQPARVRVQLPLVGLPDSNCIGITVRYRRLSQFGIGRLRTVRQENFDYFIVKNCAVTGESVFISFAENEEDLLMARQAAAYLRRCGFAPYLAKDDKRTGCDLWSRKIEPAIRASAGLLVLWTSSTESRPANVLREMEIAKAASVPVGLFLAQGLQAPPSYAPDRKEYLRFYMEDWRGDFARGILAASQDWRRSSRLF